MSYRVPSWTPATQTERALGWDLICCVSPPVQNGPEDLSVSGGDSAEGRGSRCGRHGGSSRPTGGGPTSRGSRRRARLGRTFGAVTGAAAHSAGGPPARVGPPRPGFFHPTGTDDITRLLTFFGPPLSYGLRRVELRQRVGDDRSGLLIATLKLPGMIGLFEQPRPPRITRPAARRHRSWCNTRLGVGRTRVRSWHSLARCLMRLMAVSGRFERFIPARSIPSHRVTLMLLTGRVACLITSQSWSLSTTASGRPGRLLRGPGRSGACFRWDGEMLRWLPGMG